MVQTLIRAFLAVTFGALTIASAATAATAPAPPTMSPAVSKQIKLVMDAAAKRDWATAKAKLDLARAAPSPTDFDLFEIDVVAGFIGINTGDHAGALKTYKRVIANPLFVTAQTAQEQSATLRNAMILSNEAGDYAGAVALGERLVAAGTMDLGAASALAFAYFGAGDYAKAHVMGQKVVDASVAAGKRPDEGVLQIVLKSKAALQTQQ